MKAFAEKYCPYLLIALGGLRLLGERFPHRFRELQRLGGAYCGWIFWLAGLTGLVWLLLRALPERTVAAQGDSSAETRSERFFRNYGIELLILLVTAASLAMLIRSGYFWDDAVNSTNYLAEKKDAVPTLRHVLDFMGAYLKLGRINVLSFYYYFFFYIENVSVYKALIILTILINQLVFRKTLLEFGVPLYGARLGMLLIPMLLQTRTYQDPVSGFYSLMQVLTMEMLLCALFLSRWLRTGRRKHLFLSLLSFGIGLMTYEVCFPFLLMICLLIWIRRGSFGRAVRDSLPFVLLVIALLAGVFLVRMNYASASTYAGVSFSLEPLRILQAALTQLTAGLPLSFYTAGYQSSVLGTVRLAEDFMQYDFLSFLGKVTLSDILILVAAGFCLSRLGIGYQNAADSEDIRPLELPVLGLCFAVLPVITVAMSERYQGQLMPGLGYLPVYMQYYGIAVLLVWLTLWLKRSDGARAFCLSAFALILLLNLQNNRAVTAIMNHVFYDPRNAGESALRGGILDFLPSDAVLLADNTRTYLWEADWNNYGLYPEFYRNNSRHLPAVVGDNQVLREAVDRALLSGAETNLDGYLRLEPENVWIITYTGDADSGFTRLGHLVSVEIDPDSFSIRNAVTDQMLYFISGEWADRTGVQYTTASGDFRQTGLQGKSRVRGTDDGILYALPETERLWFDSLTPSVSVH